VRLADCWWERLASTIAGNVRRLPSIIESLHGGMGVKLLVILFFLKMLATSITFGSGAVAGCRPTLVMALCTAALSLRLPCVFPAAVPQPELFVLLGMM